MKNLSLLGFVLLAAPAWGQTPVAPLPDSVATYLATSLRLFETYALNSKSLNWPLLRQQLTQQAQGARTI